MSRQELPNHIQQRNAEAFTAAWNRFQEGQKPVENKTSFDQIKSDAARVRRNAKRVIRGLGEELADQVQTLSAEEQERFYTCFEEERDRRIRDERRANGYLGWAVRNEGLTRDDNGTFNIETLSKLEYFQKNPDLLNIVRNRQLSSNQMSVDTASTHEEAHDHDATCSHGHHHDHKLQQKILGKVKKPTAKLAVSAVLRMGSLVLCPGDDIAAAVLPALTHNEEHQEILSTPPLPTTPSLNREFKIRKNKKNPEEPEGDEVTIVDLGRIDDKAVFVKVALTDTIQNRLDQIDLSSPQQLSQKIPTKHRFKKILAGAAATASLLGIAGSAAKVVTESSHPLAKPDKVYTAIIPNDITAPTEVKKTATPLTESVKINDDDSQWKIVEEKIKDAGQKPMNQVTNPLHHFTAFKNKDLFPNPDIIQPGKKLKIPTKEVINIFSHSLLKPLSPTATKAEKQFQRNLQALNKLSKGTTVKDVFMQEEQRLKEIDMFLK